MAPVLAATHRRYLVPGLKTGSVYDRSAAHARAAVAGQEPRGEPRRAYRRLPAQHRMPSRAGRRIGYGLAAGGASHGRPGVTTADCRQRPCLLAILPPRERWALYARASTVAPAFRAITRSTASAMASTLNPYLSSRSA